MWSSKSSINVSVNFGGSTKFFPISLKSLKKFWFQVPRSLKSRFKERILNVKIIRRNIFRLKSAQITDLSPVREAQNS